MDTMTGTNDRTIEYRIRVAYDEDAESPGGWDEPFTLVVDDKFAAKRMTYRSPEDPLSCGICGRYPSDHEGMTDEDFAYDEVRPHHWMLDAQYECIVVIDSRGPHSTIHTFAEWEVQDDPGRFEVSYPAARDVIIGAFVNNLSTTHGDGASTLSDDERAEILAAVVRNWQQWLEGDVWWYLVEARSPHTCPECGEVHADWEIVDSLHGIYGSEYVREAIREYVGLTDDQIDNATKIDMADWL